MTAHPIILILGPTAGGKTRLSIDLANALPGGGECIGADSMQVYRHMDIGTAKPTAKEQSQARHHLIDIAEPDESGFSVDTWLTLAESTIADLRAKGTWPIVVGGTNLYVQALLCGLFEGPEPDAERRRELQAMDTDALHAVFADTDPEAAQRIHRNDRKRMIRAIEVFEQTGKPISAHQTQWDPARIRSDVRIIGLDYPPESINRRINARVRQMVADGLIEEVRNLHQAGKLGVQAREALGYKQVIDALEGRSTMDEAIEQVKIRTRRFAKQQRTWLRRFRTIPQSLWIDAEESDSQAIAQQALEFISA